MAVGGKGIVEVSAMNIAAAVDFFKFLEKRLKFWRNMMILVSGKILGNFVGEMW